MRVPLRGNSWRLLLPAALLLALLCVVASAPAKDLEEKLQRHAGQAQPRARKPELAGGDDRRTEQGDRLDARRSLGPAPAAGRGRGRTDRKQDELDSATAKLEADKHHLAAVRARLQRALDVLRERLVAIYEAGSPDMLNVVLDSASWSEVNTRAEYLSQIQEYDDSVAGRVKGAARRSHGRGQADDRRSPADQGRARRDRGQGARSRRGQRRSRGPLRRTEVGPGRTPRRDGIARVARRSAQRQPRLDLRTDRQHDRRAGAGDRHPGAADPRPERRIHLRKPGQRAERGARPRSPARSKPPTRSPPPPTSGAAATAPSNPRATTARARSASPSTAAASSPARSTRPAWRPGANPARASGSPSTPTPNTPG